MYKTAKQAADYLGCSVANVYRMSHAYELGSKVYGRLVFSETDLDVMKDRRGKVGRPGRGAE